MIDPVVKRLRENATDAERVLWRQLRRKQIGGVRFRRQYRLGQYVVGFVCLPARLVIEVDGGQHGVMQDQDRRRTEWLEGERFAVIRFWNNEVLGNIEGVMTVIQSRLNQILP